MDTLTKREREVLQKMHDEHEELVFERGIGFVDTERVSRGVVFGLIRRGKMEP